ncbi:hypothetical protein G5714_000281 [Onychostoma macrolepis]|uniref:Ig-like domain-containing protein n=1 Tax=Onychostoma macrolepis TaxID=369639 RepID=A0A7J6DG29_9TELE|nr:hypothetical protein G5714_000281 [Onychostoma macrolepis]
MSMNLLNHPDYSGRVQFFQNKGVFFLRLSNVKHEDEGMYCLRILTKVEKQRFLGYPGIELNVTELRVEIPEEVVEGESPVLFCKTTCDLSDKTDFTWYKNSKRVSESIGSNQLLLRSVSSDDTETTAVQVSSSPALTPVTVYYCEAQNQYGSQRSASVSVTSAGGQKTVLYAAAGIGGMLICICIIIVVIKITSNRKQRAGDEDEVEYASVQHHRNTGNTTAEAGCQNGNTVSAGSNAEKVDDSSVIYSSIKVA